MFGNTTTNPESCGLEAYVHIVIEVVLLEVERKTTSLGSLSPKCKQHREDAPKQNSVSVPM